VVGFLRVGATSHLPQQRENASEMPICWQSPHSSAIEIRDGPQTSVCRTDKGLSTFFSPPANRCITRPTAAAPFAFRGLWRPRNRPHVPDTGCTPPMGATDPQVLKDLRATSPCEYGSNRRACSGCDDPVVAVWRRGRHEVPWAGVGERFAIPTNSTCSSQRTSAARTGGGPITSS